MSSLSISRFCGSACQWSFANSFPTTVKIELLKMASYLTEPVCKVREYFYSFYILNETCDHTAQKVAMVSKLVLGMVACSVAAPLTAPIGWLIRAMVSHFEDNPYIYVERQGTGKVLPDDKKITIVSHNQCYMPGGYCITHGQVTPASDKKRIDANLQKVKELDPDIVCLYEVQDILDAEYISSQLPEYPFFIPCAGTRAIGPSSMMYVASKYEIAKDSIQFIPFVKGTELTGDAQHTEKGVLSFDILSCGANTPMATIISTHLQHSEIPDKPEESEQHSRSMQMGKIVKQIEDLVSKNNCVIFTGDLNLDEKELAQFVQNHQVDCLRRDPDVIGKNTWGGDAWCSSLMQREISGPLTLDYTFIAGKALSISTRIIETGYQSSVFTSEATSDHNLLFSTIAVE